MGGRNAPCDGRTVRYSDCMTNADGTPTVPAAVPPVAPVQPRYGEMAPPGYVLPTPQAAPAPQGNPTPQYSTQPYPGQPYPGQPNPGQHYGGGQTGQYYAPQQARRTKTADVTITCILLTLGLFGMLTGIATGTTLGPALQQEYAKYGLTFTGGARLPGIELALAISHVALFLAALGISIPLMVKRRTAFWVPLVAGVIAAIIFWVLIISLIAGDPALIHAINASNGAN